MSREANGGKYGDITARTKSAALIALAAANSHCEQIQFSSRSRDFRGACPRNARKNKNRTFSEKIKQFFRALPSRRAHSHGMSQILANGCSLATIGRLDMI
jgi:hypothetical protein